MNPYPIIIIITPSKTLSSHILLPLIFITQFAVLSLFLKVINETEV